MPNYIPYNEMYIIRCISDVFIRWRNEIHNQNDS
jgi:hypothetical protein